MKPVSSGSESKLVTVFTDTGDSGLQFVLPGYCALQFRWHGVEGAVGNVMIGVSTPYFLATGNHQRFVLHILLECRQSGACTQSQT